MRLFSLVAGTLLFLSKAANGFRVLPPTSVGRGATSLRTRLPAEPVPVGLRESVPVQLTRNVDRTLKLYPSDLDSNSDGVPVDRLAEISSLKARLAEQALQDQSGVSSTVAVFGGLSIGSLDVTAACLFTVVLWFGVLNDLFFPRAARPSDLAVPVIGKVLLGMGDEQWVKDFENGSRGAMPGSVLAVSVPLFFLAGLAVELVCKTVASSVFCVQIGVIGCIWAGVYEIGRIDTGDALRPREEDDERDKVWSEFQAFSSKNLERCSESVSINQVEIVRLFRRTNSRHRTADAPGSASDALLELCLRFWHQGPDGYETGQVGTPSASTSATPPLGEEDPAAFLARSNGEAENKAEDDGGWLDPPSAGESGKTTTVVQIPGGGVKKVVTRVSPPSASGFYKGLRLKSSSKAPNAFERGI